MGIAETIDRIRAAGFAIEAEGDSLMVEPFSRLTDAQLGWLKCNKAEILAALLDTSQPGNDIAPANQREWDYQRGWWKGEDGPLLVEAWTPAGNKITVAANDQAHAERIRRDNPPPIGGRPSCP